VILVTPVEMPTVRLRSGVGIFYRVGEKNPIECLKASQPSASFDAEALF
jgi:hypothetical protein